MVTTFFQPLVGTIHFDWQPLQRQRKAAATQRSGERNERMDGRGAPASGAAVWQRVVQATVEQSALTFFECANAAVTESSMHGTRTAAATASVCALLRAYERVRCAGVRTAAAAAAVLRVK